VDAFSVLHVSEEADDAAVKAAYLAATRKYPPEQNPEAFEAIRTAYEAINTQRNRLRYGLFCIDPVESLTVLYELMRVESTPKFSGTLLRQALGESTRAFLLKSG
jgi:curved DNA-binding protein CbpA